MNVSMFSSEKDLQILDICPDLFSYVYNTKKLPTTMLGINGEENPKSQKTILGMIFSLENTGNDNTLSRNSLWLAYRPNRKMIDVVLGIEEKEGEQPSGEEFLKPFEKLWYIIIPLIPVFECASKLLNHASPPWEVDYDFGDIPRNFENFFSSYQKFKELKSVDRNPLFQTALESFDEKADVKDEYEKVLRLLNLQIIQFHVNRLDFDVISRKIHIKYYTTSTMEILKDSNFQESFDYHTKESNDRYVFVPSCYVCMNRREGNQIKKTSISNSRTDTIKYGNYAYDLIVVVLKKNSGPYCAAVFDKNKWKIMYDFEDMKQGGKELSDAKKEIEENGVIFSFINFNKKNK